MGVKEGLGWKDRGHEAIRGLQPGWHVLYLDPIKVTIPPVTQYRSCAWWYHWWEVDEANMDLCILFHNHRVATVISRSQQFKSDVQHNGWEWSGSQWK